MRQTRADLLILTNRSQASCFTSPAPPAHCCRAEQGWRTWSPSSSPTDLFQGPERGHRVPHVHAPYVFDLVTIALLISVFSWYKRFVCRYELVQHHLTFLYKLVKEVSGEKGLLQYPLDEGETDQCSGPLVILLENFNQSCEVVACNISMVANYWLIWECLNMCTCIFFSHD